MANPVVDKLSGNILSQFTLGLGSSVLKHKGILSDHPTPPASSDTYHLYALSTVDDYFFQTDTDVFSLTGRPSSEGTFERTGMIDNDDSVISFTDTTPARTFTIAPTGASFSYLIKDRLYTVTSSDTLVIPDTEGSNFIYYDGDTLSQIHNPTLAQIESIIKEDKVYVAVVFWDATNSENIFVGEERHLAQMSGATHWWLHQYQGTQWNSGCALNSIVPDASGDLDIHAQFGVDSGVIADEDSVIALAAVGSTTGLPVYYKSGAAGDWRREFNAGFSVLTAGTGRAAWNEFTGSVWQNTEVPDNDFVLYHVWATNDIYYPYISTMGQSSYATRPLAEAGALTEISNLILSGLAFTEFKPIATVIFQTGSGKTNAVSSSIESTGDGNPYVDWRASGLSPAVVSPINHNSLAGLDGGGPGEYNHHTAQQWTTNNQFAYETGVFTGGLITVNGGVPANFDVTAGTGQIVDRTVPSVPVVTPLTWTAFTNETLTNIATDEVTGIFLNSAGVIVQRTTTTVSDIDFRQMMFLGFVFHTDNIAITSILSEPALAYGAGEDFRQFMANVGHSNLNGNVYGANGTNLNIDRSAGTLWATGANFHTLPDMPSLKGTALATAEVFDIGYNDGSGGLDISGDRVTAIDPDIYNPSGAGTETAVTTNRWTIQRIYIYPNGETLVMLGEAQYIRVEDALQALETEVTAEAAIVAQFGILRAHLVVQEGATDLSDTAQARFIESKSSIGGSYAGSTGESNILVNVGTSGTSIVDGKDGVDLQTRSMDGASGSGISTSYNATNHSVEIDSTALLNIVEDLSPQLGGDLDLNGNNIELDNAPADDTASGIIITKNVAANATGIGAALYMDSSGDFREADADSTTTMPCRAMALEAGTGSRAVLLVGYMRNDGWTWVNEGADLYVSTTTGGLTETRPTGSGDQIQRVAWVVDADHLMFNPSPNVAGLA